MSRKIYFFLLALLSLTAPAWASVIYVSGDQTGTWSADTVIVTREVRVPPGQSLTIMPSVEVLFQVYCKLIVDNAATLQAVGTAADSIRFDVLPPDTAWHGIRFMSASDSSRLEYCHLTHGWATGNGEDNKGGAIYCSSSSPTISHNAISENSAYYAGGGISCNFTSSPVISGNTVSVNSATGGGGICCENNSSPTINGNSISGNSGFGGGGGIDCDFSSPSIQGNSVSGNWGHYGGGIYCYNHSSPSISGNTIRGNSAYGGGGVYCFNSSPRLTGNTISGNLSQTAAGGIYCGSGSPLITGNTLIGNSALINGGGIYCPGPSISPAVVNCILWGNTPQQLYGGTPQVSYSDIQGGYTGTGNIDVYPAFVDTAQGDYRLQWGSPCIDTGDPNPIYNDPDGTRADMGAWYYDQSLPVRILLTPYNAPIQIPPEGGSFQYAIQATNIADSTLLFPLWCNLTLPNGTPFGPVLGPVRISLGSGQTISRVRTQNISGHAPAGLYHYNGYAVAVADTSTDSFVFAKLGGGGNTPALQPGAGEWANTGEEFDFADVGARHASPLQSLSGSGATPTMEVIPNPFNPTTVLRFDLPQAGWVRLEVFDIAGRTVGAGFKPAPTGGGITPALRWYPAGSHEVMFDGSGLPSGFYFAKLEAGDYSQVQKLVLMK